MASQLFVYLCCHCSCPRLTRARVFVSPRRGPAVTPASRAFCSLPGLSFPRQLGGSLPRHVSFYLSPTLHLC